VHPGRERGPRAEGKSRKKNTVVAAPAAQELPVVERNELSSEPAAPGAKTHSSAVS
jgi:hypothetical protein